MSAVSTPAGPGGRAPAPYELLAARPDRTRPYVTGYEGPDSVTELSVATTMNAVAKAAGLLRDELGLGAGDRLSIDLPVHWQLPVWTLAGLSVGLMCGARVPYQVDVRLVGPEGLAELASGTDPHAEEILACSCDAFGMPIRGTLPSGVIDVGVAVRAHPDVLHVDPGAVQHAVLLGPQPPEGTGPAQVRGFVPWLGLVAAGPAGAEGARTWVSEEDVTAAGLPPLALLRRAVIDPLLRRGSVVLARGVSAADSERLRVVQAASRDVPA